MSKQIRPNQVIPTKTSKANATSPFPRDLTGADLTIDDILQQYSLDGVNGLVDVTDSSYTSPDASNELDTLPPRTPAILGVRSQTVGFQPDGTAKVDLVLIVEDIDGITEYDIRVAKDAGNL